MRTTKTTPKGWLITLLSALFMLSGLTACSSTEDSIEDPTKPEVPINDDDWQVVPVNGGTITKDDISITFPSGTFSKEANVAITKVAKGKTAGIYEASDFYQISIPCNASKTISFNMKGSKDNKPNDTFVAHAEAFCLSSASEKKADLPYDTHFSDGEYTATMPAIMGGEDDDKTYFIIGLEHQPDDYSGSASTRSIIDKVICEGKVKNISYKLRFAYETLKAYKEKKDTLTLVEKKSPLVKEYVEKALEKIIDLGFVLKGEKVLYIDFASDPEDWGGHQVCGIPGDSGYSMWVKLSIQKLLDSTTTNEDIKCTVIHEIFHWFQSYYDPRSNHAKAKKEKSGDEIVMYEMGAVWIENLMNNGQLNANFIKQHLDTPATYDTFGFTDILERFSDKKEAYQCYQEQGYSAAPLLYYICSTNEMQAWKFNSQSIVELHQLWEEKFLRMNTLEILEWWISSIHGSGLLSGTQIDDYYIKLFTGKIVNDVGVADFKGKDNAVKDTFKIEKKGKTYPLGCSVKRININGLKDISLENKELVVRPETEGVHTYLLITNKSSNFKKYGWATRNKEIIAVTKGDSIVFNGKTLESLRLDDGNFAHSFFIVTTRTSNSISDRGGQPYQVTITLRDIGQATVSPTKLPFPSEGGTKRLTITAQGYKKFGCEIDDKDKPWLSYEYGDGNTIDITAKPNTTDQHRSTKIRCYVTNDENNANRIYLPVEVTQDSNINGGESNIIIKKIKTLVFTAQFTVRSSILETNTTVAYSSSPTSISFKQSGSTIHVSASEESSDLKETISFDIVNLTDDKYELHNSQIKNLIFYKYKTNGDEASIVLNDIANTMQNSVLNYSSKVSTGLKVTSFSSIFRIGNSSIEYTYIDDPANSASIFMTYDFERVSLSRSIPTHGDRFDE